MTESRDQRHLGYIRASIRLIDEYTREGGREAFLTQPLVQDAVLRRLETLAEAAGKLSDAVKARHPEIPWRAVVGFRNIAAHAYLELLAERAGRSLMGTCRRFGKPSRPSSSGREGAALVLHEALPRAV